MSPQKLLSILLLGVSLLMGCSNIGGKKDYNCSELLLEPFIKVHVDSMKVEPYAVLEIYTQKREGITDSISSYALLQAIADCYFWAGETDTSILILRKVMDFCKRAEPSYCITTLQAETHFNYGIRMVYTQQNDSAFVYYKKALDLEMKSSKRYSIILKIYNNLANYYQRKSDYVNASYFCQRVLFLSDSLNMDEKIKYNTYLSLADLYQNFDNFDMTEFYYGKAENCFDEVSELSKSYLYHEKGIYCLRINDNQRALHYLNLDYNYTASNPYSTPDDLTISACYLARAYLQLAQPDSARYYLELAEEYYKQSPKIPQIEFSIDGNYATLALMENNINEAERLMDKSIGYSITQPSMLRARHKNLENLYLQKNDFKNAYNYRLKVDAFEDSIRNIKIRDYIAEMGMRYTRDTTLLRKDLRITTVEKSASRWQNIALMCLLALILFAVTTTAFVMYSRRKREQEYRRQVAIVTGLRMEIVRNRVSPHFVFNALNVMMPSLDQHKELERPFRLLIEMLRNNLKASEQVAVPLEEETGLVKNFLQLQMMGHSIGFEVVWQIADDVPSDTRIPSMAIQIPVENAVKYAFASEQKDACIDIRITRQNNVICIVVEDNGVGYHPGANAFSERGTGNGLKMLRRTIELLNTRNQYQMAFQIENRNSFGDGSHGTRVTIMVPLEYKFEV